MVIALFPIQVRSSFLTFHFNLLLIFVLILVLTFGAQCAMDVAGHSLGGSDDGRDGGGGGSLGKTTETFTQYETDSQACDYDNVNSVIGGGGNHLSSLVT